MILLRYNLLGLANGTEKDLGSSKPDEQKNGNCEMVELNMIFFLIVKIVRSQ